MSDNREEVSTNIDIKDAENIDSDKSFESCVNSVTDGIKNITTKDDDSEKSYKSCSLNIQDKKFETETEDNNKGIKESIYFNKEEEDDDDDIRPGSCRENPSSDDDISSWDENNDHWIYDAEFIQESENAKELPKAEVTKEDLLLCEVDLEYIIENHVSKENVAQEVRGRKSNKEKELKENNNPTFIPTNGKFYMHDLRSEVKENLSTKNTKNNKNFLNKSYDCWSHDLYDESKQKPISQVELINKYGVDIKTKNNSRDVNENKSNNQQRPNNFKRKNYQYQQQNYYDYGYYDDYDKYYYDNNGYYYDYNYYERDNNYWNRSHRPVYENPRENRNVPTTSEPHNYKSNYLSENKSKKAQKPPSKYSQIAEYTDIKITVNLDNFGAREIKSISNSNKKNYNSRTYENSNLRKTSIENRSNNGSQKNHAEPRRVNNSNPNYEESTRENSNLKNTRGNLRGRNYPEMQRNYNSQKTPTESSRSYSPVKTQGESQWKSQTQKERQEVYDKNQGEPSRFNRNKPVPDWVNTKFEWDPNCDFKDVIEEMPPLTEKEINQMQKRPINCHNPPPRFSRDKSTPQMDTRSQNRQQTYVPKRYSELRNQQDHHHQQQQSNVVNEASPKQQETIINYHQPMMANIDYYNNMQPLLINMNQASQSAAANSPQQPANSYPSLHPQMVNISSLLPPSYNDNQYYIQPLYLPSTGRLNQFSQPFQPSYVSQPPQAAAHQVFPTQSAVSPPSNNNNNNNTPNSSQTTRPVLGRS